MVVPNATPSLIPYTSGVFSSPIARAGGNRRIRLQRSRSAVAIQERPGGCSIWLCRAEVARSDVEMLAPSLDAIRSPWDRCRCPRCDKIRTYGEFASHQRDGPRLYGWCRICRDRFERHWRRTFRPLLLDKQLTAQQGLATEIEKLRKSQRKCHICGRRLKKSDQRVAVDHVIALAAGGPSCLSNFALAHHSCNAVKGTRRFNPTTGQLWLL